ncbi:MAG: Rieske (2Fe-2S) protein [Ignavibacteria bacterium]|nr:Rieske (2Fe-2S) protein [Ignavibacteria bacterium]
MSNSKVSQPQTKRDFLKYILGGGLFAWFASITYPILSYLKPPKQREVEVKSVKVGKLSDMEKESGQLIRFGNKPVIVVRTASGDVHAFNATCTHLDCTVQYKKEFGVIWCACHNGKYDLNGRNISGPPPKPLEEYRVVIKNEEIFVSKKV